MDDQRRKFCQLSGLVIVGAPLLSIGCGDAPMKTDMAFCGATTSMGAGTVDQVALNTATKFTGPVQFWLCRDDKGIYAVEAACPHTGTDIEFQSAATGFRCPLHGATFAFDGTRQTLPAPRPLKHFLVCGTPSGALVVDSTYIVDSDTRFRV
jgi:Rieske Fe-S protein